MAISTLDPKTALIIIDLQKGIVAYPTAHPVAGVIGNARTLVDAFRRHQLPVVFVNVTGFAPGRAEQARRPGALPDDWSEIVPELDKRPDDHVVTKRTWGAFSHTELDAILKKHGVTNVIIVGISTSAGVESTGRQAHELGYHVVFAVDAMTDTNPDAHTNSTTRIFPRIGETGTTEEIVALLAKTRA